MPETFIPWWAIGMLAGVSYLLGILSLAYFYDRRKMKKLMKKHGEKN